MLRYHPVKRKDRRGKPITENERRVIQWTGEYGIPASAVARFLQRDVSELGSGPSPRFRRMREASFGVDLIFAYRFLYYVKGISILSDKAYDELERKEIKTGDGGDLLETSVGSDVADDYPPHVRALASYLIFKYSSRDGD
jgi:hypothetical protein